MGGHFYWETGIIDGLKLVAHRGESIASKISSSLEKMETCFAIIDPHTVLIRQLDMNFFPIRYFGRNHDSALEAADKVLFMPDALSYIIH